MINKYNKSHLRDYYRVCRAVEIQIVSIFYNNNFFYG